MEIKDPTINPVNDLTSFGKENFGDFYQTREMISVNESFGNEEIIKERMGIKDENEYYEEMDEIWNGNLKDGELVQAFRDFLAGKSINPETITDEGERENLSFEMINDYMKPRIRAKSFEVALENQKEKGIEIEGFESEGDFSGLREFMEKSFSKEILDKALISKISYFPEIVNIALEGGDNYYLPFDKYEEWKKKFPKIIDYKVRAMNSCTFNETATCLHSNPIEIYSFIDENLENFEYLEDLSESEKMKIYKFGTIAHEIGHNLYLNIFTDDLKSRWQKIVDEVGHLTHYSRKYSSGIHGNQLDYSEEFAEAIRLKTTAPKYLESKFPNIFVFIQENLSEIN